MRTILKSADAALAIVVLAAVVLAACSSGSTPTAGDGRIRVVVAENFWGSIARQIAGADAVVTSIISKPGADPHDYEPTPDDARSVAGARIVIENGIGYDPWMKELVDADASSSQVVLDVGKLLGVAAGGNPHQWYSRAAVERVSARVAADLEAADPAHRDAYERNQRYFDETALAQYNALIATIQRRYAGTPIGASESIAVPLAATLGLRVLTPAKFLEAVAEGNEPSASDKATADAQIRKHRIAVLVFNGQNSTPDVQRLVDEARAARIPVVTITETLTPANATFQSWQTGQLRALAAALGRATGR